MVIQTQCLHFCPLFLEELPFFTGNKLTSVILSLPNSYLYQSLLLTVFPPSLPVFLLIPTEMTEVSTGDPEANCSQQSQCTLDFYANKKVESFILFPYQYKSDLIAATRWQQRQKQRVPGRSEIAWEQTNVWSRFFT